MQNKNLGEIVRLFKTIDGWLTKNEGLLLYLLAKRTVKGDVVEIGSWKGKSTVFLGLGCLEAGSGKVYAVDPHKGDYGQVSVNHKSTLSEFKKNIKRARLNEVIVPVIKTSKEAAEKWNKPLGLLFIDGLHDFGNSELDFRLWSPFIKEGGIIAFHDAFCGYPAIFRVIEKYIFNNPSYQVIGTVGSVIYIKKLKSCNFYESINNFYKKILIAWADFLSKSKINIFLKNFLINMVIKLLLLDPLSFKVQRLSLGNYYDEKTNI